MFSALLDRAKEPSTYAGLASIAAAFGVSQPVYAAVTTAIAALAGVVAIFLKEKAS
jgi:hypothetical protein